MRRGTAGVVSKRTDRRFIGIEKQHPEELEKLVKIAKIQSTEASNAIEGIVTTNTRIRQLVYSCEQ